MSSIMDVAIGRLSDSSCSEYELRQYLEEAFASLPNLQSSIDSAIKGLKDQQLINDYRLAMNLAHRYAHKGNCFIAQILAQKGVSKEMVTTVLLTLENENVRALDEARKKLGGQWDSSEKAMTLLHRFLRGRRFSYAAITTVIRQLAEQKLYSMYER